MKIALPLSVIIPRKKKADLKWILNLNNYRNTHYHTLDDVKSIYSDIITAAVMHAEMPKQPPYYFIYTVFPGSARSFDTANVCSIVDKFTADALQELGIIENDNYKIIPKITYQFGKVDKENPRVELEIKCMLEGY